MGLPLFVAWFFEIFQNIPVDIHIFQMYLLAI